ncbi:NADP-dependent oxidoreductase [Bacillus thuringiensis]|uniref:NADP-dependent oxidoreductase n=1 Tax=Bacillus thuringiensis TaxID=1428 RepID=UPI003458AD60
MSLKEAATITAGASTAWKALFKEGGLEKGQKVLIHAAAGGVGQFAVQLAKWKGAEVIGTVSTDNIEFIKSLGADQAIDYRNIPFEEVVSNIDLVIDAVGGDILERSWSIIKKGGTLVSLVQPPSEEKGKEFDIQTRFNTSEATQEDLCILAQLLAEGTIHAEIEKIYPLHEVRKAHQKSELGHARGRILLQINSN